MILPAGDTAEAAPVARASESLQQQGIDPAHLTEEQLEAVAVSTETAPIESIEIILKKLNILTPDNLLKRCNVLLDELRLFASLCEKKKHHAEYRHRVEYSHFMSDVQKEVELMEKDLVQSITSYQIKMSQMTPERTQQLLTTSNLPFLEAIWDTAKRSSAVTGLRRHGSIVDIFAEAGQQWIKVSTISEKRLLMEMANKGWEWHGMSDSDSEDDDIKSLKETNPLNDDEDDISLVKMAKNLARLSKKTRMKYKHPQISFVLTRISSGNKDIDTLLDKMRSIGCTVQTAEQIPSPSPLTTILETMVPDEFKSFTATLNIDCTILLAIVSDISHGQVASESWFNNNIRRQIQIEEKVSLMLNILWPAMAGRNLVCSQLAAQRMREIVDMIGTDTEKERTRILFSDDTSLTPASLRNAFQEFSIYPVPGNWILPIRVLSAELNDLSRLAKVAKEQLTDINQSVFLTGWMERLTTITSNRIAAKAIEKAVEEARESEDNVGPDVWICPTARSLVAKEKDRRDGPKDVSTHANN